MPKFRRPNHYLSLLAGLALAVAGILPATLATAQGPDPAGPIIPPGAQFAPNEVVVQFKPGVSADEKAAARARANASQKKPINARTAGDLEVAALPPGLAVARAVGALQNHPAVAFAEPNWIYEHQADPNDPYFTNGSLWGLYGDGNPAGLTTPNSAFGSQAAEAWAGGNTGNSSVYVCVIDEGIDPNHPDLAANLDAANSMNFYGDNNADFFDPINDDHGTHVAGTIGAVGGNSIGVVGVAQQVKLVSAKFLGPNGGYLSDAVEAVDHCTTLKQSMNLNIVASNNSWGGGGYSQALHDAIIRGANAGILFLAAAGNGNRAGRAIDNDKSDSYPSNYDTRVGTSTQPAASYDAVIAVAAIDQYGSKASWSNYGATTVDLGAPGVAIWSTLPGQTYGSYNGTSMATPHVSGGAALYANAYPGAPAPVIKQAILDAARATPTSSLAGITVTGGRLNVSGFLASGGSGGTIDTIAPETTILDKPPTTTTSTSATFTYSSNEAGSTFECRLDPASNPVWVVCPSTGVTYDNLATGTHTFEVRATDAALNTDASPASYTWTVEASAPAPATLAVNGITPNSVQAGTSMNVTITGSGFAAGVGVAFLNGNGPAPSASNVVVVNANTLTATVTASSGGPPRSRVWDVQVTNPGGSSAVLSGGLTVTP